MAQSVTLSATNSTLKVGRISLTGVRWARLLWKTAALADVFAKASLEATNLEVEFPEAHYGSMSVEGIANRAQATAAILLRGQGDLMDAGTLKVVMSIPITPSDFSLHYSGSLSAMDLTRLDAFLDIAEHTRIKSGRAQEAAFEIDVTAGQARGRVRAIYEDLEIAVLDKQTGTEKGFDNRATSFLANLLKIRNANAPDASGSMKEGEVRYTRRPQDEFLQFAWFALRGGVLDVISH